MKKLFLTSLFIFSSMGLEAVVVVSFGEHCSAAAALRTYNIRMAAYPFDWVISHYDSLYHALDDDFKYFMHENYLTVRGDKHGVIDHYGFQFVHDFPTIKITSAGYDQDDVITENVLRDDWKNFIPQVQEKYLRRIERLRAVLSSSEKVYIVRHYGIDRNLAIQLRDLIQSKYPNLDFTLIVVSNSFDFKNDWNIDRIKNYFLDDSVIWNDPAQWKNIYNNIGLIPCRAFPGMIKCCLERHF